MWVVIGIVLVLWILTHAGEKQLKREAEAKNIKAQQPYSVENHLHVHMQTPQQAHPRVSATKVIEVKRKQ